MKKMFPLLVLSVLLSIFISACGPFTSFRYGVQLRQLDVAHQMTKMTVDQPNLPSNVYFVQALFSTINNGNGAPAVQGVKFSWKYVDGVYVTTIPLNKVKFEINNSKEVPEFEINWDRESYTDTRNYALVFQTDGDFNPNSILESNPQFYSQVVFKLNQADYDLVMSYIFK